MIIKITKAYGAFRLARGFTETCRKKAPETFSRFFTLKMIWLVKHNKTTNRSQILLSVRINPHSVNGFVNNLIYGISIT